MGLIGRIARLWIGLMAVLILAVALARLVIAARMQNAHLNDNSNFSLAQIFMIFMSLLAASVAACAAILMLVHVSFWHIISRYAALAIGLVALALDALVAGYAIKYFATGGGSTFESLSDTLAILNFVAFGSMLMELFLIGVARAREVVVDNRSLPMYHQGGEAVPHTIQTQQAHPTTGLARPTSTALLSGTEAATAATATDLPVEPAPVPLTRANYCSWCSQRFTGNEDYCRVCGNNRFNGATPRSSTYGNNQASRQTHSDVVCSVL